VKCFGIFGRDELGRGGRLSRKDCQKKTPHPFILNLYREVCVAMNRLRLYPYVLDHGKRRTLRYHPLSK
jgi:hypothetical protein